MKTTATTTAMKTSKVTIFDRIRGYFQMQSYMRRFQREKAERSKAIAELRKERITQPNFIML